MKIKIVLAACATLFPLMLTAHTADASDYCREYTKNIRVGGHIESGYGQACLQPDGSWLITDSRGTVDPFEDLYSRDPDVVLVSQQQPVYYAYGRSNLRPVYYYPRNYYRTSYYSPSYYPYGSSTSLVFNFGDNDRRGGHYNNGWNNHGGNNNGYGHGNNNNNGNGGYHGRGHR